MEALRSFKDLLVWQKAHAFVLAVYRLTQNFSKEEQYGLTLQFRRAGVSVAANIAEGFTRRSSREKIRMLNIAHGSREECKYYIILSKDLSYGSNPSLEPLAKEVSKMLNACIKSLDPTPTNQHPPTTNY
ncbi:four helix bundle protein [Chryseolinea serpens]|uniref:Four helix bundle protein n=1 Tax=Chryseolinea serpens TaxID=947013 RepID=A0A1M5LXF4_9BACT|nr:four helix bundle protein [Chryseolinea serpens]SHG69681.1 four helix bundle protein [Chryseolinea serpens]